jgi:hypothetical protein
VIADFWSRKKLLFGSVLLSLVFGVGTYLMAQGVAQRQPTTQVETVPEAVQIATQFRVTETQPRQNGTEVSTAPLISAAFNRSLENVKAEITLLPSAKTTSVQSEDSRSLSAVLSEPLKPNTTYTASILLEEKKIYEWQFKTIATGLTTGDGNALEKIKSQLPYQGNHFRIVYISSQDTYQVVIDAKPVETYYQQALNWFKSQGLKDTNSLKINRYQVGAAAQP